MSADRPEGEAPEARTGQPARADAPKALADLLNRVLDRGVVVGGDVTLSVAGVDLVYLRLSALLTSVATAREKLAGERRPERRAAESPSGAGMASRLPSISQPQGLRGLLDPRGAPEPSPPVQEAPHADAERSSGSTERDELPDALRADLARVASSFPQRMEIDPDAVQRDLARLVLTIVELLRRVVEHQAVRRMDDPQLTEGQVERMGVALDRLDQQMRDLKRVFGLADDDLNIDLGDLGTLL